ncbi:MAG: hypothetical protein BEU00_01860 [Marine Group III euryarchaeote CG-Epi3]|jgi:threonine/homoserine/homoserine lactone efflux protein|uniref:Lysine transporter LysE n=1 Tax=Marine Group III euryarchaeote CG-Epi3 TaxID=1888997 RepID=A0A1J5TPB5_9ARCH|nr:MAG: hypothetical protein BEU00_01860 [Marine Group III euryarchaeote CG-Epi3]|tara:strand:+ start:1715 stop:2281 length:567 start_codon:yes stop_codon:yes gene_type:complete
MGAMSPGPSLAVVLRNTISGGRLQGILTSLGHGLGFGIYALIAVTGLSALLLTHDSLFFLLQWGGVVVLLWLSYGMITNSLDHKDESDIHRRQGFAEGFLISFLNPKILVFLVAIFSQFIDPEMDYFDKLVMAILAGIIDTTWYVFVAVILTGTSSIDILRSNSVIIDRSIGFVLLFLALTLILKTFF